MWCFVLCSSNTNQFLRSAQPLLPAVSALLSPQYGTHSLLAFTLVHHHTLSVVLLKPTVSSRPLVPPSGLHKCLRFGLQLTLCTVKDFTYLLTYLLTYFWTLLKQYKNRISLRKPLICTIKFTINVATSDGCFFPVLARLTNIRHTCRIRN